MEQRRTSGRLARALEAPLHPFFFAAYAVVFLWSANVTKTPPGDVVAPLVAVLLLTALVFALLLAVFRASRKAGLLATTVMFVFLAYGHVISGYSSLITGDPRDVDLVIDRRVLLIGWLLLAIPVVVMVLKMKSDGRRVTRVFNVVLGALLLVALMSVAVGKWQAWRDGAQVRAQERLRTGPNVRWTGNGPKRDIYVIDLDRHGSERTLRELYGFDHSAFFDGLRERGFYVASDSTAPYPATPHSVQTTLNMDYVDLPAESKDWYLIQAKLKAPRSARFLKGQGYKYVLMGTRYHRHAPDPYADLNILYITTGGPTFSEFANVLYRSTVVSALGERFDLPGVGNQRDAYDQTNFQFERLSRIAEMPEPTFTFAHILSMHEPLVIDADGEFIQRKDDPRTEAEAYVDAVRFTAKKMLAVIDRLLAGPDESDPIIVLQADEGSKIVPEDKASSTAALEADFGILNAYYLPGVDDDALYPTISPVNSLRVVFNEYFNADLAMLPDRSYSFHKEEPYVFTDVTDQLRE